MTNEPLPPGVSAQDVEVYRRTVARCWIVAGLLIELPLEMLDRLSSQAESLGPVLYPTVWRNNAQAIMEDRELIRALAAAKRDVLTTSPSLVELGPIIRAQADGYAPELSAAFREVFGRPTCASIPPAVILTALVRFIADRVPKVQDQ